MKIWLLRHGETALSRARRYQGRLDTTLSPEGRAMLRRADFTPERVYTTPLRRCAETAAILFPGAALIPVSDLREMDFGAFEGRSAEEMREDAAYRAWVEGGCLGFCPGGEDKAGFTRRVCESFAALLEEALSRGEQRLVIVAHGGTQMAVLERWGRPERPYFACCARPGAGYLLSAAAWPEALLIEEELDYTV